MRGCDELLIDLIHLSLTEVKFVGMWVVFIKACSALSQILILIVGGLWSTLMKNRAAQSKVKMCVSMFGSVCHGRFLLCFVLCLFGSCPSVSVV